MKKRNAKQVILPLITSFIWGSSFVAQSLGAGKVGGFTFTAARSIPAVLVLGALVLVLRRVRHEEKYTPQQKKDLLEGGLVCGIFMTLGTNLQQFGLSLIHISPRCNSRSATLPGNRSSHWSRAAARTAWALLR